MERISDDKWGRELWVDGDVLICRDPVCGAEFSVQHPSRERAIAVIEDMLTDGCFLRMALDELPELRVEWMTVKDSRVDATCVALHGKRKDPRGTFPGGLIAPPAHPRCRCRTVAWMPGWAALGVAP